MNIINELQSNIYKYQMLAAELSQCEDESAEMAIMERYASVVEMIPDVIAYYRYLENIAETVKTEKKRLDEIKSKSETRMERIKAAIKKLLESQNVNGMDFGDAGSISIRKSEGVIIENEKIIPSQYLKVETKPRLDEIKRAIKAGEKVDGAYIELRENIQIK